MPRSVAFLGMYPFPSLIAHWEALWSAVRSRLGDGPQTLTWDGIAYDHWMSSDLVLGMTCGWPLVTTLDGKVDVVGSFDMDVPLAARGRYRSVLVAQRSLSFAEWRNVGGVVAAVNARDSLSGWVSLCHAWGGEPEHLLVTGAHVESLRAVVSGAAQVASIDAVSFVHAVAAEPALGAVHIVGHGPLVPTLPLVTATGNGMVPALRDAIEAATSDPGLRATCAALRISGLVRANASDYAHLTTLGAPRGC